MISPTSVVNIINVEELTKEQLLLNRVKANQEQKINVKNDIIVEGIDQIKVNIASCCKPIPGDSIVGYITKGNGISVHRSVCPNISDLDERLIDISWNSNIDKKYSTSLLIYANDNKNVLVDVISKTASSNISVQSINSLNSIDNYMYELVILIIK